MSRSRRKVPIAGTTTASSDKAYKVSEHRKERRAIRTALASGIDDTDRRLNSKNYGNPYGAPKDGKQYWNSPETFRK